MSTSALRKIPAANIFGSRSPPWERHLEALRLLLLAALAGISIPANAQSKPRLLNVEELVTSDDYPATAAKNGQEGTVIVAVRVGRDGLAESCEVKQSSGHVALDEQSCAVFRARARFEPARDHLGRFKTATYEKAMVWRLEGNGSRALPRQAWLIRSTLFVAEGPTIVDCKAETVGLPPLPDLCGPKSDKPDGATQPIVEELTTTTQFVPVPQDKVTIPPDAVDGIGTRVAQQVSEVTIDPDGTVSRCLGIRYTGEASPDSDACRTTHRMRFDAVAPDSQPLTGTLVTTGYIKKRTGT